MAKELSRQELMSYARGGVEARIAELEAEIARLRASLGSVPGKRRKAPASISDQVPKKRKMSAAGRAKIAAAAKARWAKWRAEKKGKK